jgi:hypothetical protein
VGDWAFFEGLLRNEAKSWEQAVPKKAGQGKANEILLRINVKR